MADISKGPVSTLPGYRDIAPEGAMCDVHSDRPAAARIQGETDSFGCEFWDMCQQCVEAEREARKADCIGCCDWCKQEATDLRPRRDFEEGMSGRVYRVCGNCVRKENKRLEEELEESGFYDDYD